MTEDLTAASMADNIAEPTSAEEKSATPAAKEPQLFTLKHAFEMVMKHYGRTFRQLKFVAPMQLIDGSAVEFFDAEMGVVVATARLRFSNSLIIVKENSMMLIETLLSNMTFSKPVVNMSIQDEESKK
jgi:hypothetical protein